MTFYRLVHHVTIEYKIVPHWFDMLHASTLCCHRVLNCTPLVLHVTGQYTMLPSSIKLLLLYDILLTSTTGYHRVQNCTTCGLHYTGQYTMLPSSTKLYNFDMKCYWLVHHVSIEYKIVPLRYNMLEASTPCYHREQNCTALV